MQSLYQLLDFSKYCVGFLIISERLSNSWIVQQFFKNGIYYFLTNLQTDSTDYLPGSLGVSFSNDVNVKINVYPLLNNFRSNSIVLLFFPSINSCDGVSLRSIHYISDLFFLKHCLGKVGPLRPVLKAAELFSLALAVVIFVSHLDDLVEGKNIILVSVHTPDLIT